MGPLKIVPSTFCPMYPQNMSGSPFNIQHCAVSYNTSCKLTKIQINYDVFYDLTIKLTKLKILNCRGFRAKSPNSRGMCHCPKMVNINH